MNEENRWVKLAQLIPWALVEERCAKLFKPISKGGQVAVSVRVALGSLIIQERLGTSDRDTVENITENPYLQYFIGLSGFQQSPPYSGREKKPRTYRQKARRAYLVIAKQRKASQQKIRRAIGSSYEM